MPKYNAGTPQPISLPHPLRHLDGALLSDTILDYGNFIAASLQRERTPQDDAILDALAHRWNRHAELRAIVEKLFNGINGLNATLRATDRAYARSQLCVELTGLIKDAADVIHQLP